MLCLLLISLYKTIDAAGKETIYDYDQNTNVLNSVKYPGDTPNSKTMYEYNNDTYRLESVSAKGYSQDAQTGILSAEYDYENDLLTKITTGSTVYDFAYGPFSLRSNIKIGSRTLASYIYKDINDSAARFNDPKFDDTPILSLVGLDYGNGDKVQYIYDQQGRITKQEYFKENNNTTTPNDTVTYKYDNNGALAAVTDSDSGITTKYYYDFIDRLVKFTDGNSDFSRRVEYFYNEKNQLIRKSEFFGDVRHNTYYNYDNDNRQTMAGSGDSQRKYTYDAAGRQTERKSTYNGTPVLTETFGYDSANRVASLAKVSVNNGVSTSTTYEYEYDDNGNITSVSDGTNTTEYAYDTANQLIREDNPYAQKTYVWAYDNAGNITSREEYAYTTATNPGNATDTVLYTYGDTDWGDLLTTYDGQQIEYDDIGNPTSYYNGTRWTMTWEHGRELATISNGSTTWTNTYDASGLRTKRTNGTTTYRYRYTDGQLATMNINDNVEMWFMYDDNGPMVIKYNNAVYHYELNLQGDVVAIINSSGKRVVEYTYDAWGNVLNIEGSAKDTIGVRNPLRYRGYVYDTETGLYYLQSRYYDPELGRFINADALVSTGKGILGNNMFAYCRSNPVRRKDVQGTIEEDCLTGDDKDDLFTHPDGGYSGSSEFISSDYPTGQKTGGAGNSSGSTNGGYSYTPPNGGGGVSTSVQVGNVTVTFGHGGRHMGGADVSQIEQFIANDVVTRPPTTGSVRHITVSYSNYLLNYGYFTISPYKINVGTYFYEAIY